MCWQPATSSCSSPPSRCCSGLFRLRLLTIIIILTIIIFVTSVSMLLRFLLLSPISVPIIRVIVIFIITIAIIVITIIVIFPSLRSKVSKLLLAWLLLTVVYIFPEAGLVLFMAIHHWVGCSLHMFTLLNISRGLLKYFWPGLTYCFKGVEKEKVLFWNLFWFGRWLFKPSVTLSPFLNDLDNVSSLLS